MLELNEDEGFAQQQADTIQYRQYIYAPLSYSKSYHHNPYKAQMKIQSIKLIQHEQYINKQLQDYLTHKFTSKHKQAIAQPWKNIQQVNTNSYFDSNFQSGNLQYVIYRNNQYQLYLKPDTNTTSHFQWFYFKIRNKEIGTMNIVIKNFIKAKMLYGQGLRPFHKSINSNSKTYQQISSNVHFKQSSQRCETQFYQLSFQYSFVSPNDQVQFCSQPPYSYSRYCKIYRPLPFPKMQISRTVLAHKIQAFIVNQNSNSNAIVVVMARQHPGQSMGSWMMQGFVNKLIQNPNQICWILLPMINIDGVILGNNRTGVQGYDLNRNWSIEQDTNSYHLFPELKGIISYFKRKKREHHFKKIKMFIDFHSHSSEQNVFSFGPPHNKTSEYYDLSRIYPYLISKRNNDFNLKQCNYRIDAQKKNCSRSIFYNKFNFSYSYTIESSFGIYRGRRVNQRDALRMGESIFMSTLEFVQLLIEQKQKNILLKDIVSRMKEEVAECQNNQDLDDSGSDNEDQSEFPFRAEFNKKLAALLTTPTQQYHQTVFDSLVKKRTNNSYLQGQKKSLRQSRLKMSRRQQDKQDKQNRRMKTVQQQKKAIKSQSKNQKSTTLPKIHFTKRKLSKNKKKNEICDLDKLSLQQMKERLIKMKNSELGRRILLINRHQNS